MEILKPLREDPLRSNSKYSWRVEKKFGVIDPVVYQVTMPSTSESDPSTLDLTIRGPSTTALRPREKLRFCSLQKRLCEILAIDKTRKTALHHQSDGIVERFNRTILNSLFLLVLSNQQDWDKKWPFFLLAYRSAVHETTGCSPYQMLFGRDLRLPADLLFSRPLDAPSAPEEYIEKLQARMEEMHHLARG
ncbi:retrovirus-related Pol polyprotein from transposon 412 [Trichonephila clavipes]|uniref:Retrovirus-related Pol polyprotein from transposon 412 n=1 Tax=Trichonephila clavipes TaxID=2585209 RepID=A0A8X6SF35_TRICX|nr:retrovirus-related Pol polyprotein from transposon 412 [Trichonephila clavipes]